MAIESSSNGDEKSRRHPRWTRQETLTLIQAKEITENSPNKGRKIISTLTGSSSENTEPKWVMISTYCKHQGANRGPAQCRKRWSNLIGDFRKIKVWESKLTDKIESFWAMRNDLRKEKKLPVSFDVEVFKVLEGRELGSNGAVSPLPLQAVPAVPEDVNEYIDGDDDEDDDAEEEEEEIVGLVGGENKESMEMENGVENGKQNGDEDSINGEIHSPAIKKCTSEPVSGIKKQQLQACQEQKRNSNLDAKRKSWPDTSNCDTQDKGKRGRLCFEEHNPNCFESQILRALEANNKLKKEHNDVLIAALAKLTDVVTKLADKL
ncbi:trihelix transcription factor ASR3-like [Amaranthus tricolor]|uniref:trihelix transcription factor ASR3-like n=1 Tax=Amaranthus tricolor TaxID=29722 RepID=UPI002584BA49|nr:trihelix transcription factor ASR3-like [Amaranthus tricolor]